MKGNKYGRKFSTQTIVTYENNRLVTKTIVHLNINRNEKLMLKGIHNGN